MRRLLPVLASGAAALLTGCGGAPDPVTDRDGVVRVQMTEYRLEPQDITVRAGRIRFVAANRGELTHNLVVQELEREIGEPAEELGRTETAQPGDTVEMAVELEPGHYRILCSIGNHDDLGQYGDLRVRGR